MDPELQRLLGDLLGRFPEATADSIFTALGAPENPIAMTTLRDPETGHRPPARFRERDRQIDMDTFFVLDQILAERENALLSRGERPSVTEAAQTSSIPAILAHEVFHNTSVQPNRELRSDNPQVQGLVNLMNSRFDDATPEQKSNLFTRYYGFEPPEELADDPLQGTARLETMAQVVQDAFSLARRANQQDQETISGLLTDADERLPGTREAFNFFVRRFPREEPQ